MVRRMVDVRGLCAITTRVAPGRATRYNSSIMRIGSKTCSSTWIDSTVS